MTQNRLIIRQQSGPCKVVKYLPDTIGRKPTPGPEREYIAHHMVATEGKVCYAERYQGYERTDECDIPRRLWQHRPCPPKDGNDCHQDSQSNGGHYNGE